MKRSAVGVSLFVSLGFLILLLMFFGGQVEGFQDKECDVLNRNSCPKGQTCALIPGQRPGSTIGICRIASTTPPQRGRGGGRRR